ncbi:phage antirepressor [Orenia marismortui]|uniref:phage antirepressor n=1 Tax=Orenia marismortui TaxID=46469 RepID=UPI0003819826|nr:phage antirepressor KilAC domain-containing protein [Orenia marismortui]
MSDLQIFNNDEFGKIRVVTIDNEPSFVAKDVCNILDLGNTSEAMRRIKNRWVRKVEVPHPQSKTKTMKVNSVTEAGLYKLVMRSNKPEAEDFTDWIAEEVLPSIRKHGMYAKDEILDNPDLLIEVATKLKNEREERKRLEVQIRKKDQLIGELKPKADYTDTILKNKSLVTITQIAKDYGMSGRAMNSLLHELDVQYKQSDQWLLYAKYSGKGYTHSSTFNYNRSEGATGVSVTTKWTQKGRLFLYNLLKENGIVPTIERDQELRLVSSS